MVYRGRLESTAGLLATQGWATPEKDQDGSSKPFDRVRDRQCCERIQAGEKQRYARDVAAVERARFIRMGPRQHLQER